MPAVAPTLATVAFVICLLAPIAALLVGIAIGLIRR